jgi:hypothetical protein
VDDDSVSKFHWVYFTHLVLFLRACLCLISLCLLEEREKKCRETFHIKEVVHPRLMSSRLHLAAECCEESKIIFGDNKWQNWNYHENWWWWRSYVALGLRMWVGNKKTFIFPNEKRLSFIICFYEHLSRRKFTTVLILLGTKSIRNGFSLSKMTILFWFAVGNYSFSRL